MSVCEKEREEEKAVFLGEQLRETREEAGWMLWAIFFLGVKWWRRMTRDISAAIDSNTSIMIIISSSIIIINKYQQ